MILSAAINWSTGHWLLCDYVFTFIHGHHPMETASDTNGNVDSQHYLQPVKVFVFLLRSGVPAHWLSSHGIPRPTSLHVAQDTLLASSSKIERYRTSPTRDEITTSGVQIVRLKYMNIFKIFFLFDVINHILLWAFITSGISKGKLKNRPLSDRYMGNNFWFQSPERLLKHGWYKYNLFNTKNRKVISFHNGRKDYKTLRTTTSYFLAKARRS